jgi:hypothetical protein
MPSKTADWIAVIVLAAGMVLLAIGLWLHAVILGLPGIALIVAAAVYRMWGSRKMSDTSQAQGQPGRDNIATRVLAWSGLGILAVSIAVIASTIAPYFVTGGEADEIRRIALTVFNTLVPMFGTWVGTVIAFYFARENFAEATKSTRELVGQLGDDRLKQIPVKEVWIPVDKIEAAELPANGPAGVSIDKLREMLELKKFSRAPVWDANKVIKYILHESLIFKYLVRFKDRPQTGQTLEHLLTEAEYTKLATAIAFVGASATLADAKKAMDSNPDCQDVFVTTTGQASAPVAGWITNVVIAKSSKASA